VIAGKSYTWNMKVKLYKLLPSFAVEEPSDAIIYAKLYKVTSNGTAYVTDLPEDAVKLVKPGVYSITLSGDFTTKYMGEAGAYIIQFIIGHPKSGITVIKNVETTSLGAITTTSSPTTTTSTVVSTTTVSGTVTIATTKIVTSTATVTATSTLVKTTTVPTTVTTTQTVTATNWGVTAAVAIILFIIGLVIGFAVKRK